MSYYTLFNLTKEPFANTPDPAFLYQSKIHKYCLQQLQLSLELKRGLNLVIGQVGTGKTTLCRKLLTILLADQRFVVGLILDPAFESPEEFLQEIYSVLYPQKKAPSSSRTLKEEIKTGLLELQQKGKTPVILIDEGQKTPIFILETLRELLNFETNENKLLQVIIFAQEEFLPVLEERKNFKDRIHLTLYLTPLNLREIKNFLQYRLRVAGADIFTANSLFTWPAIYYLKKYSQGYPRKLIHLAHKSLLQATISNKDRVSCSEVKAIVKREKLTYPKSRKILIVTGTFLVFLLTLSFFLPLKNFSTLKTSSSNFPKKEFFLPASLGSIEIKEGYVPVKILSRIYNLNNLEEIKIFFPHLLKVNPKLKDLNSVYPGLNLNIPARPFLTLKKEVSFDYVYKGKNLEDLFQFSLLNDPEKKLYLFLCFQKPKETQVNFYLIKRNSSPLKDNLLSLPAGTVIFNHLPLKEVS